jgi:hypothetical protein
MGYVIESVEAAKPDAPGTVIGRRNTGWAPATPEGGEVYTAIVHVRCSDRGAEFEAITDESVSGRVAFRNSFPKTITLVAERRAAPRRPVDPDTSGLLIDAHPQRSHEATAEFGADLPASGITPLYLKIRNRSQRTYEFSPAQVELVTQEGTRTAPLPVAELAQRVGEETGNALRSKLISAGELAAGGEKSGFLYFPSSAYRRATVVLIDQDSGEPEGFRVEF